MSQPSPFLLVRKNRSVESVLCRMHLCQTGGPAFGVEAYKICEDDGRRVPDT